LEDEQKRYRAESQKLILDIQRVTQDLDHETIARVQLENEKQSLEEEINFLKQIHSQEIEELKQANLIGTALDPSNFFKHELSNAIRDIREEYEQLNNQQRNELESWYRIKVTQAVRYLLCFEYLHLLFFIRYKKYNLVVLLKVRKVFVIEKKLKNYEY
jgi:hypothetical protein